MNIPEILQKSKTLINQDVYIIAIIILVGFAGFGLGRLSKTEELRVPIVITQPQGQIAGTLLVVEENAVGTFVASKNGTRYHFPWCSGAQRIKESNKVWFASKEEAIRAGYTPALNCKGL